MGQRHQIYVRFPKKQYADPKNPNNRPAQTFGFHHQWLYGTLPLAAALRILDFHGKNLRPDLPDSSAFANTMGDAPEAIRMLLSLDHEHGHFHAAHHLSKEGPYGQIVPYEGNPMEEDNNDGITLIDFSDVTKPKVGFVLGAEPTDAPFTFKVVDALTFLSIYYPEHPSAKDDSPERTLAMRELGLKLVERLSAYKTLTTKQAATFFGGKLG
jgi:hypothetical protein